MHKSLKMTKMGPNKRPKKDKPIDDEELLCSVIVGAEDEDEDEGTSEESQQSDMIMTSGGAAANVIAGLGYDSESPIGKLKVQVRERDEHEKPGNRNEEGDDSRHGAV